MTASLMSKRVNDPASYLHRADGPQRAEGTGEETVKSYNRNRISCEDRPAGGVRRSFWLGVFSVCIMVRVRTVYNIPKNNKN
jgi:hypothetical protein